MQLQESKIKKESRTKSWDNLYIGITGANGSLGRALTKLFRVKGAYVIGLTHRPINYFNKSEDSPNEWIQWSCGEEVKLSKTLKRLDILIINHGVNRKGNQSTVDIDNSLEVNALSSWRLIKIFEEIAFNNKSKEASTKEVWVNTSEAEIQPALSPTYEISKRLLGEIVSIKWNNLSKEEKKYFKIRKLILGPFKSELNPIGIVDKEIIAKAILRKAASNANLIVATPNPITYILMPITELLRSGYCNFVRRYKQ